MVKRTVAQVLDKSETTDMLDGFTRNINTFLYLNRSAFPNDGQLLKATEFIQSQIGFDLSTDQIGGILMLYPHARIKLVEYNGLGDTEVRDLLLDMMADFFLGCDWPKYGDKLTEAQEFQFRDALQKQARLMSFTH